jgi:coiled-coil domain-containing protein 41
LDAKIKDVEELKQKVMTPKDMEIARFNNLNEFELTLKKKWKTMDGEIAKYRSNYYTLKREHEELLSDTLRLVRLLHF